MWVDGEKTEAVSRYDALLEVALTEGTHTVELRFVPKGVWAGVAVSGVSVVLVAVWLLHRRKKRDILRSA